MLAVKFLGFALLARVSLATPLSLTILHTNDHHSHLEANRVEIEASKIAGLSAQASSNAINVELGGYPRIVSGYGKLKIDAETAGRSVLKLHAGDAITGTAYYSMFKGEADAKMMSLVCFDAFSLGNHEFDDGDQALANFIDKLQTVNASCATPVLAANVVPAATSPLLGKLSKSVVLSVAGQQVGIVGIDVRNKTLRSSSPSAGTTLTDERTAAQAEIDMLLGQSIDKIVLVTHMGYDSDMSLMATLRGVDVVIGGDSHSLLGDSTTREVDFSPIHGEYATVMRNADGKMVCVVQAWEYNKAIGELEVDFDTSGDVLRCGGQPRFPYASQIQSGRRRSSQTFVINSSDTASVMSYLDSTGQFMLVEEDAHTAAELSSYQTQVEALKQETIAYAPNKICFDRWPGQGAGSCPIAETREQGGGACQLVARLLGGDEGRRRRHSEWRRLSHGHRSGQLQPQRCLYHAALFQHTRDLGAHRCANQSCPGGRRGFRHHRFLWRFPLCCRPALRCEQKRDQGRPYHLYRGSATAHWWLDAHR